MRREAARSARRRYRQPEFRFGLGEPNPKPPPGAKLPLRPPQRAHLARGIAIGQRIFIKLVGHGSSHYSQFMFGHARRHFRRPTATMRWLSIGWRPPVVQRRWRRKDFAVIRATSRRSGRIKVMNSNSLSNQTTRLVQDIRLPCDRQRWLSKATDRRVQLANDIAASGEFAAIPLLLDLLFDESPRLAIAISDCLHHLLQQIAPKDLPVFDEQLRQFNDGRNPARWNQLLPADVPRLPKTLASRSSILGLASLHRNGYVREAAVCQLDLIEDGREIPFLLLRLNDWVAGVRKAAVSAIHRRLVPGRLEDFVRSIHLVFRLVGCKRDDHSEIVAKVLKELVAPQNEAVLDGLVNGDDRRVRRRCFRLAIELDRPHRGRLIKTGLRSSDAVIRLWAANRASRDLHGEELENARTRDGARLVHADST